LLYRIIATTVEKLELLWTPRTRHLRTTYNEFKDILHRSTCADDWHASLRERLRELIYANSLHDALFALTVYISACKYLKYVIWSDSADPLSRLGFPQTMAAKPSMIANMNASYKSCWFLLIKCKGMMARNLFVMVLLLEIVLVYNINRFYVVVCIV
jgi:hypothetical protein